MMSLVDTHCHLDFAHYNSDRDIVFQRAWNAGVKRILVPGVDIPTSHAAVQLAKEKSGVFAAIGVHPNSSGSWDQWTEEALNILSRQEKVVAIGEIGLDYYRNLAPKDTQKKVLRKQLALANRFELPVIIHTRNANPEDRSCISDVISILSSTNPSLDYPGVVHSYSGNIDEALKLISLGYFLGITGPVTYPNAEELRKVVAAVPLERLLIETDGPFLTPQPRRGKRNEPAFVRYIADKIAVVRAQPVDIIIAQIRKNAARLFQWEEMVQGDGRL